MKNTKLNILLLFFVPVLLFGHHKEGKFKKTKVIHHEYELNEHRNLHINNSYGNIHIINWDKNSIDIKVIINVDGDDATAVSKRINSIDIELYESTHNIHAITQIKSTQNSWNPISWVFGSSNNTHFKINYEIKIPASLNLNLVNEYGNLFIDKLDGKLDLNLSYGKFTIGELLNDDNVITTEYLSNSTIDFIKGGALYSDYSKMYIQTAYKLKMTCDYATIHIGDVRELQFQNDYGSLKVDNVKIVTGSGDYQKRSFAQVDYLDFQGDYGSLHIDNLLPGFEKIQLQCDYTNIKIDNTEHVPYQLNISQSYGCFKQNGLTIYKEINDNGDKSIMGFYGDRNAGSSIKITEDYGCIKIYN